MADRFYLHVGGILMLAALVVCGMHVSRDKRVQEWLADQRPAWMDQAHREVLP